MFRKIRRFTFFFILALLTVYFAYEYIVGESLGNYWPIAILYSAGLAFMVISFYKEESMEEVVGDFDHLRRRIEKSRFSIFEQRNNSFILKPRFDYPYSLFNGDMIYLRHLDDTTTIEGPKYYVEGLVKDIRGDMNIFTRFFSRTSIFIIVFAMGILPFIPSSGPNWDLKQWFHNNKIRSIEVIEIEDEEALGNSLGNINNYGYLAESEDYIFYVHDHMSLIRADKNFENPLDLISQTSGFGISNLNVVEDWIFYSKGDKYKRMRLDGSEEETIYNMTYVYDLHIRGNWIYFINTEDDFRIYKMDINGSNIESFLNISATDIAVYEDRLYFSYPMISEATNKGRIESIGLDGYDKRDELDVIARDIIIHDGYFYYINTDDKLSRAQMNKDAREEILTEEKINSFAITDYGVYYTLGYHDQPHIIDGNGLYRIDFDGSNGEEVLDYEIFAGLSHVGDYLLFSAHDEYYSPHLKKLDLRTGVLETLGDY